VEIPIEIGKIPAPIRANRRKTRSTFQNSNSNIPTWNVVGTEFFYYWLLWGPGVFYDSDGNFHKLREYPCCTRGAVNSGPYFQQTRVTRIYSSLIDFQIAFFVVAYGFSGFHFILYHCETREIQFVPLVLFTFLMILFQYEVLAGCAIVFSPYNRFNLFSIEIGRTLIPLRGRSSIT